MGWGFYSASHLLYSVVVIVKYLYIQKSISLYFRLSKSPVTHHNFQLLSVLFLYYIFCNYNGYNSF